jgi:hypothetical protein
MTLDTLMVIKMNTGFYRFQFILFVFIPNKSFIDKKWKPFYSDDT